MIANETYTKMLVTNALDITFIYNIYSKTTQSNTNWKVAQGNNHRFFSVLDFTLFCGVSLFSSSRWTSTPITPKISWFWTHKHLCQWYEHKSSLSLLIHHWLSITWEFPSTVRLNTGIVPVTTSPKPCKWTTPHKLNKLTMLYEASEYDENRAAHMFHTQQAGRSDSHQRVLIDVGPLHLLGTSSCQNHGAAQHVQIFLPHTFI